MQLPQLRKGCITVALEPGQAMAQKAGDGCPWSDPCQTCGSCWLKSPRNGEEQPPGFGRVCMKCGSCGVVPALCGLRRRVSPLIHNSVVLPYVISCSWTLFVSVICERCLCSVVLACYRLISAVYEHPPCAALIIFAGGTEGAAPSPLHPAEIGFFQK